MHVFAQAYQQMTSSDEDWRRAPVVAHHDYSSSDEDWSRRPVRGPIAVADGVQESPSDPALARLEMLIDSVRSTCRPSIIANMLFKPTMFASTLSSSRASAQQAGIHPTH